MSWLKERERYRERHAHWSVSHGKMKSDRELTVGMTTLFVLYWMINMCYADMGPQSGHGWADTEGSMPLWSLSTSKLES